MQVDAPVNHLVEESWNLQHFDLPFDNREASIWEWWETGKEYVKSSSLSLSLTPRITFEFPHHFQATQATPATMMEFCCLCRQGICVYGGVAGKRVSECTILYH